MRTEELVDSMHRTMRADPLDLERITRQGRRLLVRRRAAAGGLVAVVVAAIAVPFALTHASAGGHDAAPAVGRQEPFAPAQPAGTVADTGDKFYWGSAHSASLGPEAIWVEAGDPAYQLSFGFHDEETGQLVRVGARTVPSRTGEHVELPALPRQAEPTYVGMFRLPDGADAQDYSVAVEAGGHTPGIAPTEVHQSGSVRPGYLVFWVTAGEDLASQHSWWAVEDARGDYEVSGSFQPQPQAIPGT